VKQILKQSYDARYTPEFMPIYKYTHGIIFMGVPHRGSLIVPTAKKLSLLAMGRADRRIIDSLDVSSALLEQFANEFAILLRTGSFKVHNFVETEDLVGIPGIRGRIVERFSCVIGDACEVIETLQGDHCSMCRFKSLADDNFKKVWRAVEGYVHEIEIDSRAIPGTS
jgi:hypothetical protein